VTRATSEQTQALVSLTGESEEVRRIAKQTARAVGEQADALASLATTSARQTSTVQTIARATAEQTTSTEQVAAAMREVRVRTREIATTFSDQVKATSGTASDIALIAQEIGIVRRANVEQANLVATLSTALGVEANGASAGGNVESS
jgi:methyl-accepting chemotaxis protein